MYFLIMTLPREQRVCKIKRLTFRKIFIQKAGTFLTYTTVARTVDEIAESPNFKNLYCRSIIELFKRTRGRDFTMSLLTPGCQ